MNSIKFQHFQPLKPIFNGFQKKNPQIWAFDDVIKKIMTSSKF